MWSTVLVTLLLRTATAASVQCRTDAAPWGESILHAERAAVQLSWATVVSEAEAPSYRGAVQQSYEVTVIDTKSSTVVWSSGVVVNSAQRHELVPADVALAADTAYTWSVKLQLSVAGSSPIACPPLSFDTAPSATTFPGSASWIGGGGQLRSTTGLVLPANANITRARAHVSGLGAFYFYLNGEKVGLNVMDPPQSVYSKTVYYTTYDATALLRPGHNDVGAVLGNYKFGYTDIWCNMTASGGPDGCRALIMRLDVELADGSIHTLDTSDPHAWQARSGPVLWDQ